MACDCKSMVLTDLPGRCIQDTASPSHDDKPFCLHIEIQVLWSDFRMLTSAARRCTRTDALALPSALSRTGNSWPFLKSPSVLESAREKDAQAGERTPRELEVSLGIDDAMFDRPVRMGRPRM
ncbi:hypothetical protein AC579_2495 [Pseudocercospora musae]|uniref:Uncharacterized protein n=1 Tax=Pseudocercospora musae TaxID=113226 RepID=A0A139IFE1_9PEZI|nr:hypothetical protein AC579_2495 [Pseudocercospora musae]